MRRRWMVGVSGILGALLLVAAGCGGQTSAPAAGAKPATQAPATKAPATKEKVAFRLNWVVGGYHAPYYVAKEKGFFAEEGLDVEIQPGRGSVDTVKLVANNSAQFGLADAVSIIPGKVQGMPIKSVAVIYQTNPFSIISLKDANITKLKDLEGRTFGAVPGGSPYILYKGLLKANKIDSAKIKEVTVDAPGIAALLTKNVDAITLFFTEIAPIEAQGQKLNVIKGVDNGLNIYGLAIAAHESVLKNPKLVKGFLKAVKRGIEYAEKNPDEAVDLLIKNASELKDKRDLQKQLLKDAYQVMKASLAQDASIWDSTQKSLADQGAIPKTLDPKEYFTTEFQP